MFRKVEINIPLLDTIKQIPKYTKFLKELCVNKRKKMNGNVEVGGIVSGLTKSEDFTAGAQSLLKKCRDPRIFQSHAPLASVPLPMPFSKQKCRLTRRYGGRNILEGINLDSMETIPNDSQNKDVHAEMLSMEFGDTLVQFNIFEAMKHPTEDHSLFGIDLIDELVEEYFQLGSHNEDIDNFAERTDSIGCLGTIADEEADYDELGEIHNLFDSEDNKNDIADLGVEAELLKHEKPECSVDVEVQVAKTKKLISTQLAIIFMLGPKASNADSPSSPPPMELKPFPGHLKYAYLDTEQQLPVIIANNLHLEQEDKLLNVLRQHKKEIGWTLSDLSRINPSICMHRILMEEAAKPIRKQQRRINSTILDVVKKEVTKLLVVGIIYPILDSQ
ncbi:hypothetical protein CR513_22768, partial [Mucuna pruriens]